VRRHERLCPARFAGERAFGHLMRCYVLQSLVQPNKEVSGCLPRAQDRWSCYAGSPALMASGGVRRCARGPGVVELLRSPKLHRWMSDNAVKVVQGSGGSGVAGGEKSRGGSITCGGAPGKIPAAKEVRAEGRGLGEVPGQGARLLRASGRAEAWRSSEAMAAWGSAPARRSWGGGTGVWGGARGEGEGAGGRGVV